MTNEASYNVLGSGFDTLASANQAAVTTDITATPVLGEVASTVTSLITLSNQMRADLVTLRAIKGSA